MNAPHFSLVLLGLCAMFASDSRAQAPGIAKDRALLVRKVSGMRVYETGVEGVYVAAPPESGFDPMTANNEKLLEQGFPPRPSVDAPSSYLEDWRKVVAVLQEHRVIPTFETTNRRHGPTTPKRGSSKKMTPFAIPINPAISNNWSGYAISDTTNAFQKDVDVYGATVVTRPGPPDDCNVTPETYASSWVGVDGYGISSDVLQGDIGYVWSCTNGVGAAYSWVEWYPANEVMVSNFPVYTGDIVRVSVNVLTFGNGTTTYTISFADFTNHTGTQVVMAPPPGTTLVGNTIEWVSERPGLNGATSPLASLRYSGWPFQGYVLNQANGGRYYAIERPHSDAANPNAVSEDEVTMQNLATGDVLCRPEIGTNTVVPSSNQKLWFTFFKNL